MPDTSPPFRLSIMFQTVDNVYRMAVSLRFPRLLLLFVLAAVAVGMFLLWGGRDISSGRPVAVVAPAAYPGLLLMPSTVGEQAARADLIVVGRVRDVTSRLLAGTVATDVTLDVERYLKGSGGRTQTITLPGGQVGPYRLFVGGVPNFLVGERALLFLESGISPRLVQLWQSKYSLAGDEAIQLESNTRLPITAIEGRIGRALGREVRIGADGSEAVSIGYTTYCSPWSTTDMPVPHEVNPANPGSGGPSAGAFVRLVYDSLHNWQALPDSYPSFSITGTTSNTGTDHFDRHNTIAWADLDALGSGVIGVNYCATQGGARIDSDTLIDTTGFTWDADDSDGIAPGQLSLQSVMEHELGHGLGLGHSEMACDGSASTPLMCPAISFGVRKNIQPDDQAGAASLYPLSGSQPAPPTGLTVTADTTSNTLSWTGAPGSLVAYDIERSASGCSGSFRSIQTVAASATTYVDDEFGYGLGPGDYCYRVKALGLGGDSPYTNAASAAPEYAVTWGSHNTPTDMTAGDWVAVDLSFTNAGSLTWQSGGSSPVRLSYHWLEGACPGSATAVWDGYRASLPADIGSGEAVTGLSLPVQAPPTGGEFCLVYDLVEEYITWFSWQGAATLMTTVTVNP